MSYESARVRAYRAARLLEPSQVAYDAAMSVYVAAFGKHPGDIEIGSAPDSSDAERAGSTRRSAAPSSPPRAGTVPALSEDAVTPSVGAASQLSQPIEEARDEADDAIQALCEVYADDTKTNIFFENARKAKDTAIDALIAAVRADASAQQKDEEKNDLARSNHPSVISRGDPRDDEREDK